MDTQVRGQRHIYARCADRLNSAGDGKHPLVTRQAPAHPNTECDKDEKVPRRSGAVATAAPKRAQESIPRAASRGSRPKPASRISRTDARPAAPQRLQA